MRLTGWLNGSLKRVCVSAGPCIRFASYFTSCPARTSAGWPLNLAWPGTRSPWCRSSPRHPIASIPAATGEWSLRARRHRNWWQRARTWSGFPDRSSDNKRVVLRHAAVLRSIRCENARPFFARRVIRNCTKSLTLLLLSLVILNSER